MNTIESSTVIIGIMMKDEERIIKRCLASCIECQDISAYCIIDTGSSDQSISIVKEFLDEHHKLYKILSKDWVNFGHNRTELYTECIKFSEQLSEKNAYVLLLDADMLLTTYPRLNNLIHGAYMVDHYIGDIIYKKPTLLSVKYEWVSVGEIHEYWKPKDVLKIAYLPYARIDEMTDGYNRKDKFDRDLTILLSNDTDANPRTKFYIAQTLKDMGRYDEAISYYKQHLKLNSWEEERWYSMYMLAVCETKLSDIRDIDNITRKFLDAYALRPQRAEPLYRLAMYLISESLDDIAFIYINHAKDIELPRNDILFVERKIYSVGIPMLYVALCNTYVTKLLKARKFAITKKSDKLHVHTNNMLLLATDIYFNSDIERKQSCVDALDKFSQDLFDSYAIQSIDLPMENDVLHTSITYADNAYLYLVHRKSVVIIYFLNIDKLTLDIRDVFDVEDDYSQPEIYNANKSVIMHQDHDSKYHVKLTNDDIVLDEKYCVYTSTKTDAKTGVKTIILQNLHHKIYYTEDSMHNFPARYTNIDISNLQIIGQPIITDNGKIFMCKCCNMSNNVYTFIMEQCSKIVAHTKTFKISKMNNITNVLPVKNGKFLFLSKTKLLLVDIGYVLSLFG